MTITLAFDVYGTLIDTSGVIPVLEKLVGQDAVAFSQLWRDKQLEYSFRRGLMQNYQDFSTCTRHALEFACLSFGADLPDTDIANLLAEYERLPAFPDVHEGLPLLGTESHRLFAFSNGRAEDVHRVLFNSKIIGHFEAIVSVDDVKSFKPSPAVYTHFLRTASATGSEAWMVSSNPFDVIGAISAGMRAAWVRRSAKLIFDPWGIDPTVIVESLVELPDALSR